MLLNSFFYTQYPVQYLQHNDWLWLNQLLEGGDNSFCSFPLVHMLLVAISNWKESIDSGLSFLWRWGAASAHRVCFERLCWVRADCRDRAVNFLYSLLWQRKTSNALSFWWHLVSWVPPLPLTNDMILVCHFPQLQVPCCKPGEHSSVERWS